MICVKLDYSFREVLKAHVRNVFWMCDGCAEMFSSDHFRKLSSRCTSECMPDEVSLKSLKDDIAGLKDIVKNITSQVDSKPINPVMTTAWSATNRMTHLNPLPNTPKRRREGDELKEKPSNIRGTKTASELVKTVSPPEELFWLYLSAFDPSTSNNEIVTLVKSSLMLTDDVEPKVVRLVPKDKDPTTLNFVTFKVGFKKSLKDLALSKETWPENVYFREFETRPKNQQQIIRVATERNPHSGQ